MPILIKAGDTAPTVLAVLLDAAGEPVDLVDATVRFVMADAETRDIKVNSPAQVRQVGSGTDGSRGAVAYVWQANQTNPAGKYLAEFEVLFSNGQTQSFPTESYVDVTIFEDLGGNV